jgi:hypothetical protein
MTPTAFLFRLSLTVPLAWAAFSLPIAGQRLVDSGYRGSGYSFRSYRPRKIRSLNEVPSKVIRKLSKTLRARVGRTFYSELKFDWGEEVEFDELYKFEPDWRGKTIAKYCLVFHFSNKSAGLKAYHFVARLNKDGELLEGISLPNISEQPNKSKFISFKKASEIANVLGFKNHSSPGFEYFADTDSFVWVFNRPASNQCHEDGVAALLALGSGPYQRVYIEAHSGRVLKTECYRITV